MALTERQQLARKGKMTASRVGALMSGDSEKIYDLWLELTGDPTFVAPDYTNVWAVQLGNATEKFHLDWIEGQLGPIAMRGKSFQHPKVPWALATLDGWVEDANYAVEAKHTGGFETMDVIIDRYMPQMHWTMFCTDTEEIAFSVIMGAKEPQARHRHTSRGLQADLIARATEFMGHVFNLTEPVANPYAQAAEAGVLRRGGHDRQQSVGVERQGLGRHAGRPQDFRVGQQGNQKAGASHREGSLRPRHPRQAQCQGFAEHQGRWSGR